jgi:hypothetical protein
MRSADGMRPKNLREPLRDLPRLARIERNVVKH